MKLTNNSPRFGWGFSAFFLMLCAVFTYIAFRDGTGYIQIYPPSIPDDYPPWVLPALLTVFWIVGLSLAGYFAGKPCVAVEVLDDGSVMIDMRYLFKRESCYIRSSDIAMLDIVETRESEGDAYFTVRLTARDDLSVDIAENAGGAVCEDILARFKAVVNRAPFA